MGTAISAQTAASAAEDTDLIPIDKAGAGKKLTVAQVSTKVIDDIEAKTPGASVAAGNSLFALQSGVLKPVDIDLVTQRALDLLYDKSAASIADADLVSFETGGAQKTITATNLAAYIRAEIESAILDISDLSSAAAVATTDYVLLTQGTTPKKTTVQALYDAIYTGLAATVAAATNQASPTGTDVLYLVRSGTAYRVTLANLATYVASTVTLSGSGTADLLAKWTGTNTLGASLAINSSSFSAGSNDELPTSLVVRTEMDQIVNDATAIGADLADGDAVLVYDASATAQRNSAVSRIWTYILAKITAVTSLVGYGFFIDEDSMATDSATKVPSQQSVKAYVDATAGGTVALTRVLINGATDVGGALADGDEFPIYDLSATANRKSALSRIYTYLQSKLVLADVPLLGGTDIGADLADADLILVDDGATGTNRKSALSRVWTYILAKITAVTSLAGYGFFVDEDDMVSNSATKVPSQQSVKAYVDAAAPAKARIRCTLSGNQAMAAGLYTAVQFDTETSGWKSRFTHSTVTNNHQITADANMKVMVSGVLNLSYAGGYVSFVKDTAGTPVTLALIYVSLADRNTFSATFSLSTSDILEMHVYSPAGGNLNTADTQVAIVEV
jgi:hypothetical protein